MIMSTAEIFIFLISNILLGCMLLAFLCVLVYLSLRLVEEGISLLTSFFNRVMRSRRVQ